jgi:polyhydroxyalkanoate synthesis regulator phasin
MSSLDKVIIHPERRYRCAVYILISVIITATTQWFLLKEGNIGLQQNLNFLQKSLNLSRQNTQQLSEEKLDLHQQNKTLNEISNSQLHEIDIQQATVEELQQQLMALQDQVFTLDKELLFYQNITQGISSAKLQIRELHLTADTLKADTINYRIVITQGKQITKPMTGSVSINIDKDPTVISKQPLNLRFVQLIEGQITIADSTSTKFITISIKKAKKTLLSRTFDWQLTPSIPPEAHHVQKK